MSKPGYTDQSFWLRLIFMVLYWLALNIAISVFGVLVVLVSLMKLGSKHEPVTLASWLGSMTLFLRQIFDFLAFEEEEKPFPFQPWPQVKSDEET